MDLNIDIKKIRANVGLNQTEFAEQLGLTQTLISKIEAGKSNPTFDMVRKIHKTFGLHWDFILFSIADEGGVSIDNIGEQKNDYYEPKNKQESEAESNKKLINTIEKLVDNLLSKESQIDKLIDTIQQLTKKFTE